MFCKTLIGHILHLQTKYNKGFLNSTTFVEKN